MQLFSSKSPIHSVRFRMRQNSYYICLRSCKSHQQENEKFMSTTGQFSRTDSTPFKDRSFIDLIDLVMRSKRDEHLSLTFHIKQGKMIHFSSLVKCDVPNRIQSLSFFQYFWLRSCKSHPLENEKFTKTRSRLSRTYSLPFKEST